MPNGPKPIIEQTLKTYYKGQMILKMPLSSGGGHLYFTKTDKLQVQFFRIVSSDNQINNPFNGYYEFIDMVTYKYKKIKFKEGIRQASINTNTSTINSIQNTSTIKSTETWLAAFIRCIAEHIIAIPMRDDDGNWGCYALRGGSPDPAEVDAPDSDLDGGGGDIDWNSFFLLLNPPSYYTPTPTPDPSMNWDPFLGGGGSINNNNFYNNTLFDQNGFYYSRIIELTNNLEIDPYAITPCDSLNIMPLDPDNAFGKMYQRIAQFKLPQLVKDRIDSIRLVAPQWPVDNFNLQSIEDASGPIVNCDYFPVQIKVLPMGYTAKSLLEYFRKNINLFIKRSTLTTTFTPYMSGAFNDFNRFNADYENSLGALVSIRMLNDGSVIISDYYSNNWGSEKNRFKFSTIETPKDYEHPVAGNREFGIFQNPNGNGEFTFYTMGVDRTWDLYFNLGNYNNTGFKIADELWSGIQEEFIKFVKNNGGDASYYSEKKIIARPNWNDVKDFLRGNISFDQLKQKSGC
jgi:hypothetical protein